ncbi:MAG: hypothetical protein WA188_02285 [Terriglobales bacterium]
MKAKKKNSSPEHTASTFDSFLEEEGIREEVEAVAVKRVLAWQLSQAAPPRHRARRGEGACLQACRKRQKKLGFSR